MTKLDEITKKIEGLAATINTEFLSHVKERDRATLGIIAQVSWGVAYIQRLSESNTEDNEDGLACTCRIGKLFHDLDSPLFHLQQMGVVSALADDILADCFTSLQFALHHYPAQGHA